MPRTRPRARWLATACALALLAASCGGSDNTDTASGSETTERQSFDEQAREAQETSEEETEEEDVATGEVQTGGHMVIASVSDIANLDPITSSSFNTQYRLSLILERLISFDTGPNIGYTAQVLQPELATSWEISDDALTYTFQLREGVHWHDVPPVNGREFNSGDVKATFEAILAEGHQAGLLSFVESIEAPDDYTIVITLSQPFAPLLNNMASHFMWILPAEAFADDFDRTSTVIGTGPFMLGEREVDVKTEYVRNPNYWETDENGVQLPYMDGVTGLIIADVQQAIAAFKAGEITMLTHEMAPELREQVVNDVEGATLHEWVDAGMGQIGVNMDREPFNDLRVRQAISYAVDREGMGTVVRDGGTIPTNVSPALADYVLPEAERYERLQYDPERAQELLAEAGYPDGIDDVVLIASNAYGASYVAQAEWLAEDLSAVGINVNLEILDYATYFTSRWPEQNYDLQFGPQTPFLEPDEWLRLQMGTDAPRNWYGISDPTLDAMIEEQLSLVDKEERAEKIQEIQRYALDNLLNPIPVWTVMTRWVYSPELQNFHRHGSYGYHNIDMVWLAEE